LFNLHPLITPLIGFAFPVESGAPRELKTVRLHAAARFISRTFLRIRPRGERRPRRRKPLWGLRWRFGLRTASDCRTGQ
jgi:hypothetical protein